MSDITIKQVPLSSVVYRSNYRQAYDESFVCDVAGDMAEHGYKATYPLEVYAQGDQYVVIDGNTRYHAAQLAQVYSIKSKLPLEFLVWIAVSDKPSDGEYVLRQIEANKARRDTDPISDGKAFQQALAAGYSVAEIARRCHTTVAAVNTRLALLGLASDVQELVIKGHLPISFASAMDKLDTNRQHIAVMAYNKSKSPNVNDFKDLCGRLMSEQIAEGQTSFFGLLSIDEITARANAEAESISSEPKKSMAQLIAELESERKARQQDREYARSKYQQLLASYKGLLAQLEGQLS